ncbi:MAG: addiction module protein [Planctomycetota bacterium]|nr:addiction module protein [Planctomycetota bacterium]MDA1138767.1 addiction module protein [Planctomycetota bacterium]
MKVMSLPEESRADLAEILIKSLDEEDDASLRDSWLKEIQRRDEEIRSGKIETIPSSEALLAARLLS